VVDDEPSLRKIVANAIKGMGFTVLTAQDGVEAVKMFQQHLKEIRLVICDLTMPRMDGWETLTALRKLAPGIPVILASGYSEAQVMAGDHPELPQLFLSKPYEYETLSDAISRVIMRTRG
jgi:CheY-like chemotaxis protein